jgi:hypothetical protein
MAGSVVLESWDKSGVSVVEFGEVFGGLGLCFFKIVLRLWLKELPTICCQSDVGGSCTRVDRPGSNKTGASEDAPRTATIKTERTEACRFIRKSGSLLFSLSKPIADVQRPLKAIVEKLRPPVHERRCVLREMS